MTNEDELLASGHHQTECGKKYVVWNTLLNYVFLMHSYYHILEWVNKDERKSHTNKGLRKT